MIFKRDIVGLDYLTLLCFCSSYIKTLNRPMLTDIWRCYRSDLICRHKFRMWLLSLNSLEKFNFERFCDMILCTCVSHLNHKTLVFACGSQCPGCTRFRMSGKSGFPYRNPLFWAAFTELLVIPNPQPHGPSELGSLLFSRTSLARTHVENIKVCLLFFCYRQLNLPY